MPDTPIGGLPALLGQMLKPRDIEQSQNAQASPGATGLKIARIVASEHIRIAPAGDARGSGPAAVAAVAGDTGITPQAATDPLGQNGRRPIVALSAIAAVLAAVIVGLLMLPKAHAPAPAATSLAPSALAAPPETVTAPPPRAAIVTVKTQPQVAAPEPERSRAGAGWQDELMAKVTAGTLAALRGPAAALENRAEVLAAVRAAVSRGLDADEIRQMLDDGHAAQTLKIPAEWIGADGGVNTAAVLAALEADE
ncbi:MAG: hypothetical protein QNJ44_22125 [Rhodobacter sp.]|nr:hypothetical protein [Rhodobacter sp.]